MGAKEIDFKAAAPAGKKRLMHAVSLVGWIFSRKPAPPINSEAGFSQKARESGTHRAVIPGVISEAI
jgi:hypothetical protein